MSGLTRTRGVGEAQKGSGGKAGAAAGTGALRTGAFGEYEVVREIGRGGMGVVYQARHRASGRTVALKVMLPTEEAGAERQFVREASIAARLHHPAVVGVHEIGAYRGVLYFAMDLVEGTTLDAWLRAENPSLTERLRIFLRICEAVGHAHARGVIHLDLKPQNILMGPKGEAFLTDFGLARRVDERPVPADRRRRKAEEASVVGTPWYMSPEQIAGRVEDLDARSDVFSLGIMLYKLLTGRVPFDGADYMAVLNAIQSESPRAMGVSLLAVPAALELIVGKALKKRKEQRYHSVRDFSLAITNYLSGRSGLFSLRRKVACL